MSRALLCLGLKTGSENSAFKIYVKLSKTHDMSFVLSEIKRMKCDTSSPMFHSKKKLQKLMSVNTEIKRHLGYHIWHHLHKQYYALKGSFS